MLPINDDVDVPLRVDVLGPLRVRRGVTPVELRTAAQRTLLAVLALRANRPVDRDRLVDDLWDEEQQPTYAVNLLQKRMSELRAILEPGRSPRRPSALLGWTSEGYLLTLPEDGLDLWAHDTQLVEARAARGRGDLPATLAALDRALDQWRGPAFAGLSAPALDAERDRLAEIRLGTLEDRADLVLMLGRDEDLVPDLRRLVADHPLRDRLRVLLIRALHRAGHQADALDVYHDASRALADQLGIDPGPELRAAYQQVLEGTPLDPPAGAAWHAPLASLEPPVPAELPHPLPGFVGRGPQLESLDALRADAEAYGELPIMVVVGTAGVGKTSLAVRWARQVREHYPDGQLYVNLRGFDTSGPLSAGEAVRGFLTSLDPDAQGFPLTVEAQAAQLRSRLAGRRMLLLVDNASDAEQVRPLLPGDPGHLVIVTSRNRLASLVATDGAKIVEVGLLDDAEADELLIRRVGRDRVAAEPSAVAEIVRRCARLPLALSIVAARAATQPALALSSLADDLGRSTGRRLDAYAGEDAVSDVRSVLSWSYARLSSEARELFRAIGLHAFGPDIGLPALAELVDHPLEATQRDLGELVRASLVEERGADRIVLHDLLKAYAAEVAQDELAPAAALGALERVLGYYRVTARAADHALNPPRVDPFGTAEAVAADRTSAPPWDDRAGAQDWLATERPVLVAAVPHAHDRGLDEESWRLAAAVAPDLEQVGHWHDAVPMLTSGLAAARRTVDDAATASMLNLLGRTMILLDRGEEAATLLGEALDLVDAAGTIGGRAEVRRNLAWLCDRQQRYADALGYAQASLDLLRADGSLPLGEGRALNAIGWFQAHLGQLIPARATCEEALELQQANGDQLGSAETLDSLGLINGRLGDHDASVAAYERAAALYREVGDRYNEADTRIALGDALLASGDQDAARAVWTASLAVLDELGHPNAAAVRRRLARTVTATAPQDPNPPPTPLPTSDRAG